MTEGGRKPPGDFGRAEDTWACRAALSDPSLGTGSMLDLEGGIMRPKNTCACGCGKRVTGMWAKGHNLRGIGTRRVVVVETIEESPPAESRKRSDEHIDDFPQSAPQVVLAYIV